jgi:hypothetical protein
VGRGNPRFSRDPGAKLFLASVFLILTDRARERQREVVQEVTGGSPMAAAGRS